MLILDHVAVACERLEEGIAHVEDVLGVSLQPGGQHAHFGTHNALLGLEDGLYFEVIAIDPAANALNYPRWFNLDKFDGTPRLTNWIVRTDDMQTALAQADPGAGRPVSLTRGDLSWQMAVPTDGLLPFDNLYPAIIEWGSPLHPAKRLAPSGCRLTQLTLTHPDASRFAAGLAPLIQDERLVFAEGPAPKLTALFDTPNGMRTL